MTPVQVSDTHQRLVVELDDIQDSPESEQTERGGCGLEIQTKAILRFVITENAPTRVFSWLNVPTSHPCPQGRYTQSFRFKLVISYKSCMRPRLTEIQGDSNLFTDFFLR